MVLEDVEHMQLKQYVNTVIIVHFDILFITRCFDTMTNRLYVSSPQSRAVFILRALWYQ